MTEFEKDIALAQVIHFVPPKVQKQIIDFILRDVGIKLSETTLSEYEQYFERVEEKFQDDYMKKR